MLSGTIAQLLLYGTGDSKMMLSFAFLPFGLAIFRRMGVSGGIAFGIGFVVLYLGVIAPLVGEMRNRVQRDENGHKSLVGHQDVFEDVLTKMNAGFQSEKSIYLQNSLDGTMLRLSDSVPAGWIANMVVTNGILWGDGMRYVPTAFVPRMLWHDKPAVERGRYFTAALGIASSESTAHTSIGQTSAGELFWNFGWPGVILGMYLLGVALSVWWGACGANPTSGVLEMTAFLGATTSFVLGEGAAAGSTFVGAITAAIVLRLLVNTRDRLFRRAQHYRRNSVCAANGTATWR